MYNFFQRDTSVEIPNQFVTELDRGVQLWIKREDLLHPEVSGNKFRKLKYNLLETLDQNCQSILTFGGAHSNHIAATAAAGKILNLETIGIIRGEELENASEKWSATLKYADSCGMKFAFISREAYREKDSTAFQEKLKEKYPETYIIPEGGTNRLAVKGCTEILSEEDKVYDHICVSVGTGGTIAGLINSSNEDQNIMGFSALKSKHLSSEVSTMTNKQGWLINTDYHFGGYAKINRELVSFMNDFRRNYKINLDPVYTGKLLFGIFDLAEKSYFPENSKILAIHTGGLQGVEGMNEILQKKGLPQIE